MTLVTTQGIPNRLKCLGEWKNFDNKNSEIKWETNSKQQVENDKKHSLLFFTGLQKKIFLTTKASIAGKYTIVQFNIHNIQVKLIKWNFLTYFLIRNLLQLFSFETTLQDVSYILQSKHR